MQQQTNEELCNLLIQSLEAKDEKALLKVLDQEDEAIIQDIINRVPVHHVRKFVIELRNVLSEKLTINHLKWLQQLVALKFSVISSMADGRSVLLPLISLLDDRSSPAYYIKLQALKGKIQLLKQLKEARKAEATDSVVRLPIERDQPNHIEVEVESETDSEEDFEDEGLEDGDDDDVESEHNDNNEEEDIEEDMDEEHEESDE